MHGHTDPPWVDTHDLKIILVEVGLTLFEKFKKVEQYSWKWEQRMHM